MFQRLKNSLARIVLAGVIGLPILVIRFFLIEKLTIWSRSINIWEMKWFLYSSLIFLIGLPIYALWGSIKINFFTSGYWIFLVLLLQGIWFLSGFVCFICLFIWLMQLI